MKISNTPTKVWGGQYQGIAFEIKTWKKNKDIPGNVNSWAFYIYIHLDRIPDESVKESFWIDPYKNDFGIILYPYYNHPVIPEIELAGGCTWYSKEGGHDGAPRVVKLGCHYQHVWNSMEENIESVKLDVKAAIQSFRHLVPGYKYWCLGNGNLYDLSEGEIKDSGHFVSNEYLNSKALTK